MPLMVIAAQLAKRLALIILFSQRIVKFFIELIITGFLSYNDSYSLTYVCKQCC